MELVTTRPSIEKRLNDTPVVIEMPSKHLLTPTQRRIWEDEGRKAKAKTRQTDRLREALTRYEPIVPPYDWSHGAVEHNCRWFQHYDRFDRLWSCIILGIVALIIWLMAGLVLHEAFGFFKTPSAWIILAPILFTLPIAALVAIPPHREGCRWYTGLMPAKALEAYHRAKSLRLFDSIMVYSPRREDFQEAAPRMRFDPLLIGRIGDHSFLLAYWNLDEDLKLVDRLSGLRLHP